MRNKKCKVCKTTFTPARPLQAVCSPSCAIEKAKVMRERAAKKEYRAEKEKQKGRDEWIKDAQDAFNAYIRQRDADLPCISCGRHHQGQYHAGHYRTRGAHPELRFNELNVHKQCAPCNDHLHGNLINYRIELIKRIGQDKVDWLEGKHEPAKYTIEQLKAIKTEYTKKRKELMK